MNITFVLQDEDYLAFQKFHAEHNGRKWKRQLMFVTLFLAAFLWSFYAGTRDLSLLLTFNWDYYVFLVATLVVIWFAAPALATWLNGKILLHKLRKSKEYGQEVHMTFSKKGVAYKTTDQDGHVAWTRFVNAYEDKKHFYFYYDALLANIFPKSGMSKKEVENMREYLALVNSK